MTHFRFLGYNYQAGDATFRYQGPNGDIFTEKVNFTIDPGRPTPVVANEPVTPTSKLHPFTPDPALLDRALFLAFVLVGLSYYKTAPTPVVDLPYKLTKDQVNFFNHVYQEGLSQFAFENGLKREDLAHFSISTPTPRVPIIPPAAKNPEPLAPPSTASEDKDHHPQSRASRDASLVLVSGGKDSLLLATLARKDHPILPAYVTSTDSYPKASITSG